MIGDALSFRRSLLKWYSRERRNLPWRVPKNSPPNARVDPYLVLVSELMLQQTQVATVIPYFKRFTERFPTIRALADAPEQEVLRLWQGLGYYSRARNLHRAAKLIATELNGSFPRNAQQLRDLPGVGRYTAGAIASLAFDEPAPIVDGNVARVLSRLERIERDLAQPQVKEQLWSRAEQLVQGPHPGDFNSAMMELGATICTPRAPRCLLCPVARHCQALAAGLQEKLPLPKKRSDQPLLKRDILCIPCRNKWLIEQRPSTGRWASMWQFVTVERNAIPLPPTLAIERAQMKKIAVVHHALTHRRYQFNVYLCRATAAPQKNSPSRRWVTLDDLENYPLPRPHVRVAHMLRELSQQPIDPPKLVSSRR